MANSTRARLACVVIWFALIFLSSHAYALEVEPKKICSKEPMLQGVYIGGYQFSYKSWFWLYEQEYMFCHCIHNTHPDNGLYVKWDKTNLAGFIRPKDYMLAGNSFDTKDSVTVPLTIWYGARLQPVSAPTTFHQSMVPPIKKGELHHEAPPVARSMRVSFPTGFSSGPSPLLAYSGGYDSKKLGELTSQAIVSVPSLDSLGLHSFESFEEQVRYLEKNPDRLVDFDMKFTSRIVKDTDNRQLTIKHHCEYTILQKLPHRREKSAVKIRFSDPKLNRLMFKRDGGVTFKYIEQETVTASGQLSTTKSPDSLRKLNAALQIVGNDGKTVFASIPVTYYSE